MLKSKKIIVILSLIVIIGGIIITKFILFSSTKDKEIIVNKIDTIEGYNYHLEDRDTKLFKEIFSELKKTLQTENIDFSKYAELLAKLYITDLYTIENKNSMYDVGGSDFVDKDALENFELKVRDTIYKYVNDNNLGQRVQELPVVNSFFDDNTSVESTTYKIGEEEYPAYKVSLLWDYKKDLGYDTKANIILIKKEKILYVVSQCEQN